MGTKLDVTAVPAEMAAVKYAKAVGHFAAIQSVPFAFKLAAYPIERIRLLMQTQHTNTTFEGKSFKSLGNTISHMRGEGYLAAWRGVTPTIVRWIPSQYIILFLKDHLNGHFPVYDKKTDYGKYFFGKVGSGAATGIINALIWAYPLDVMRQQLATKDKGTWRKAARDVYAQGGLRGFYRGFMLDAPGLAIFRGVQLGGWDLTKDYYGEEWGKMSRLSRFAHGQAISLMGSVFSYPWDTVRRNLMTVTGSTYVEVYKAGVSTAGGVRNFFYAGFSARVMSSFVNGALLEAFDEWKRTRE
eukprot:TRINITY_DN275_c0_g1_i2.p1 TRINITY_DN275_c0_g1~~TRINITY_DN275_c0_g1_i2.p1  ORF type:complete len:313 (+),score=130.38 TRINITY_DN275_c0_g1_i2:43-939(+)